MECRQAEVRRLLVVTQQARFGLDRAFAYKIETGRVLPFESTPNAWNLTVELEAPIDVNSKLQEVMDIMMTETLGTDGENRTHEETASCNQTNVDWTKRMCLLYKQPFGWQGTEL